MFGRIAFAGPDHMMIYEPADFNLDANDEVYGTEINVAAICIGGHSNRTRTYLARFFARTRERSDFALNSGAASFGNQR